MQRPLVKCLHLYLLGVVLKQEFGLHLKILVFGVFVVFADADAYAYPYAFPGLCAYYASGGDVGDAAVGDAAVGDAAVGAGDAVYADAYVLSYHDLFH